MFAVGLILEDGLGPKINMFAVDRILQDGFEFKIMISEFIDAVQTMKLTSWTEKIDNTVPKKTLKNVETFKKINNRLTAKKENKFT